ncbi:MAG: L-threonylcarbamoyladenylate synthase [Pseudomonadales bacterium]
MVSNSKTTELKTECTKQSLLDGAVIAYPTEGVWGLGCAPESTSAVQRLLEIKQRPKEPGLILVAAEIEQFEPYLSGITPDQRKKLEARWPGPVTFVVPDTGFCPEIIKGHHTTVALRVSAHPIVRALCRLKQGPLVSTSANRRGEPPAMSQGEVFAMFGDLLDFVIPGALGGAAGPSEIVDLVSGRVLRPGQSG